MAYAWTITRDLCYEREKREFPEGEPSSAVGVAGPSRVTDRAIQAAKKSGAAFRMKDDDGEVYYHGRITGDGYTGFEPLDDFGTPFAGCVTIEYFENRKWVPL